MYRGFTFSTNLTFSNYLEKGRKLYGSHQEDVIRDLNKYLLQGGVLDGEKMQAEWFPQVEADVFISHYHQDADIAIGFAGYLSENLGLKCFVDSCIWGYVDDLLWTIDNAYCTMGEGYFNYNARNRSTSYVHMMLSTALNKMIDNTECLLFLSGTESIMTKSITTKDAVRDETRSPWIYAEIEMSRLIRRRHHRDDNLLKSRYYAEFEKAGGGLLNEGLGVAFPLDKKHLTLISETGFERWINRWPTSPHLHALDLLYELYPKKVFI